MLKAIGVHKSYTFGSSRLHVLKGIDLDIDKGSIVAIVGPSGAGKSTFLHLLGALDEPNRGEVLLEGRNIYETTDPERARIRNQRFGFVFQFYHLLPEFSAVENVMLPALVRDDLTTTDKWRAAREKTHEILTVMGLEDRLGHRPAQLSGGEQQRVAIARALINQPDVVFCDEPTGNLDSKTGNEILGLIRNLNKRNNQTFVIVTHETKLIDFADRVVYMKDGRLE